MINQVRSSVRRREKAVRNVLDHGGGCLILDVLQLRPGFLIALRQYRNDPGIPEEAIVGVKPHRRRRKAKALDEGELEGLGALRSVDLHRLADGDRAMAVGQEIDAFVTCGYQCIDVLLAGQERPAVSAVSLARERR